MIRIPVPTAREVRGSFYVAAAAALALVAILCWAIVQRVDQYDSLVDRLASDASQIERLTDRDDASSRERAALQRQNRDIKAALRQANRQLAALVAYLREQGIEVPAEVARGSGGLGKGQAPSGAPKPKPKPTPQPSPTPASPGPTATPSPTGSPGLADVICGLLPPPVPCLLPR